MNILLATSKEPVRAANSNQSINDMKTQQHHLFGKNWNVLREMDHPIILQADFENVSCINNHNSLYKLKLRKKSFLDYFSKTTTFLDLAKCFYLERKKRSAYMNFVVLLSFNCMVTVTVYHHNM